MNGCICQVSQRKWIDDGSCSVCHRRVSEGQLQDAIRLAVGQVSGLVLWRNNIGVATLHDGTTIRFGVCNPGGSDLIGMFNGRFVAVEIKAPDGRQTKEQRQFQACVERNGGIYMMPRSVSEAVNMIEALRVGFMADGTN